MLCNLWMESLHLCNSPQLFVVSLYGIKDGQFQRPEIWMGYYYGSPGWWSLDHPCCSKDVCVCSPFCSSSPHPSLRILIGGISQPHIRERFAIGWANKDFQKRDAFWEICLTRFYATTHQRLHLALRKSHFYVLGRACFGALAFNLLAVFMNEYKYRVYTATYKWLTKGSSSFPPLPRVLCIVL